MKARMYLHILPFIYLCVIGLPCFMPWMNICIIIDQITWGYAFSWGGSVWHFGNSGFSQVFQVNWCHSRIRSIWPTLYFTRLYHELEPSYGTSMCRVYPWISKELDSTLNRSGWPIWSIGGKLVHVDLISNISPLQWNMEVQPTSNYSLGMALQVYVKLGHVDLIGDLVVRD